MEVTVGDSIDVSGTGARGVQMGIGNAQGLRSPNLRFRMIMERYAPCTALYVALGSFLLGLDVPACTSPPLLSSA
ncbi:MAG: hypothetical protein F4X93_03720 [Proteobacteria bacterium]|nr:hypothetical protein [Pseudomonadota bacterium]MYB89054.1 hypothetical protein [Pseudomonadota bacterium]